MKKRYVFVCAFFIFAAGIAAAGGKGEHVSSGQKNELLLWMPPNGTTESLDMEFWQTQLYPWAVKHNVSLEIEIIPWGEYETKYLTGFASGQGPDVGYMYLEMLNNYIDTGLLENIDGYFTSEEKRAYLYYDKGFVKGGQYTLPFIVGNARILYFNTDILEKAGVTALPETWQDLVAVLRQIKAANLKDVIPFAQPWGDPAIGTLNTNFYPFLWQAGGELYNEAGTKVMLDKDRAALRAVSFIRDLRFKYGFIPDECLAMMNNSVKEQFAAGRVAAAYMDASAAKLLDKSGIKWEYVASLKETKKAIWIACDALIMNAACKNKPLAAELMKYMTSAEVMAAYHARIAPYPPITKGEPYNDNPRFVNLYRDSEALHSMPVAKRSANVMDNLYKNLQLMMIGDLTPEQVIADTQSYADSTVD